MTISEKAVFLPRDWLMWTISDLARLCPVQEVHCNALTQAGIRLVIKREDQMHPYLTGNKLYKLYHPLRKICSQGGRRIVTFGGAYSNHILALAYAGQKLGLEVWGVIRGERPEVISPTLADAAEMGMKLHFVSRQEYRCKDSAAFRQHLVTLLGEHEIIEEGGDSDSASIGCKVWAETSIAMCERRPDAICMACGTGGSAAGVLAGADGIPVFGYLVLKGHRSEIDAMAQNINQRAGRLRSSHSRLSRLIIEPDFHGGGYGRLPDQLKHFMQEFETETGVPLDPVYTGKLLWGVMQGVNAGKWPPGSMLLVMHSGGLQGRRGFQM